MDKILIGRATEIDQSTADFINRKICELAPAYYGSPVFSGLLEGNKLFITVTQEAKQ